MVWVEQRASISESLASQIKMLLIVPALGTGSGFVIMGIGLLLLIVGALLHLRKGWHVNDKTPLINDQNETS